MPDDTSKMRLEVLLKENDRLSTDIRAMEQTAERYLTGGLAIIAAAMAYGGTPTNSTNASNDRIFVWYFVPLALFGLMIMTIDKYRNIMWLGGYKRAIEEKINTLLSDSVACWETFMEAQRAKPDVIFIGLALFTGGFQVFASFYSLYRIWINDGTKVAAPFLVGISALALLTVTAFRKQLAARALAHHEASKLLAGRTATATDLDLKQRLVDRMASLNERPRGLRQVRMTVDDVDSNRVLRTRR